MYLQEHGPHLSLFLCHTVHGMRHLSFSYVISLQPDVYIKGSHWRSRIGLKDQICENYGEKQLLFWGIHLGLHLQRTSWRKTFSKNHRSTPRDSVVYWLWLFLSVLVQKTMPGGKQFNTQIMTSDVLQCSNLTPETIGDNISQDYGVW